MPSADPIVLIRDQGFAGMSLERLLVLSGHEVEVAGSVERAVATVVERSGRPTVVLVDMTDSHVECDQIVAQLRWRGAARDARVVGIARLDLEGPESLDGLGLAAVLDRNALPEELLFRIDEAGHVHAEERRYIRVYAQLPVACSSAGREFLGTITNLGKGGIFVQCDEELAPDDPCAVRFELPSGPVAGGGLVRFHVRREPLGGRATLSGFGLELTHVDGDGRERMARFAADRQSEWRALLGRA